MNLMKRKFNKNKNRYDFEDPSFTNKMAKTIIPWLPTHKRKIVIVCIGTDRSTGDSLGPLVGTLLEESSLVSFDLFGTLEKPVHAINLTETIDQIYTDINNPFIVAIDACLGKYNAIGSIITSKGALQPGAALKKNLPSIGDVHITGVVNYRNTMEYSILQNTRLHLVMEMAKKIASVIQYLDIELQKDHHKQMESK